MRKSAIAYSRFCQTGSATATAQSARSSASGAQIRSHAPAPGAGRRSAGSRLSREGSVALPGSGVTATTVAPQLSAWATARSTIARRAAASSTRISLRAGSRPVTVASK